MRAMLIELKDRQYWIDHCDEKIKEVLSKRAILDAEYEKQWRKRKWPFRNRPDSMFPPVTISYPSNKGWGTFSAATRLKKVLENQHTDKIELTYDEFYLIMA